MKWPFNFLTRRSYGVSTVLKLSYSYLPTLHYPLHLRKETVHLTRVGAGLLNFTQHKIERPTAVNIHQFQSISLPKLIKTADLKGKYLKS
jgi:hypothetical protein